jgi:hypothetical protein
MIRFSGTVIYTDGRREPFETGLRGARAWELYAGRHSLPLNASPESLERFPVYTWELVVAHAALRVANGFDVWVETVEDIDEWNAVDVPPTPPAPSPEP